MATWIIGGILAVIVTAIIIKMVRDRRSGKGTCGGDCGRCRGCH